MRETMRAIMAGVAIREGTRPRKIANNTVRYTRPDGTEVVRLHHTDILEKRPDGSHILNTGGWQTVTTKDRLNAYGPARIWSERGQWIVGTSMGPVPFVDGLKILPNGDVPKSFRKSAEAQAVAKRKLSRDIKLFCDGLDKLTELPAPSAGDCFLCMAAREEKPGQVEFNHHPGQSGPAGFGGTDHLLSHIAEGYLHGTLLLNALTWAGYREPALIWQMDNADMKRGKAPAMTKRALRRYLKRKLGLA